MVRGLQCFHVSAFPHYELVCISFYFSSTQSKLSVFVLYNLVVWCGEVWCGGVRCGVVWCGVVLCCVVGCGVGWSISVALAGYDVFGPQPFDTKRGVASQCNLA